ncbi:MAG: serine/threonine-protein phosphatase [Leptospiraceae bacterium]|nr:serine/threonine-protein phosphatase [Leptospiraceae bacterium]
MKKSLFIVFCLLFSQAACANPDRLHLAGEWKIAYNDTREYSSAGFDHSAWSGLALPVQTRQGVQVVWIRRTFQLPSALRDQALAIFVGKIIDTDIVYLNGIEIGRSGSEPPVYIPMWNYNRYYFIPPALLNTAGPNVLAIRSFASIDPKFADDIFISTVPDIHGYATWKNTLVRYLPMSAGIMNFNLGVFLIIYSLFNKHHKANLLLGLISILWGLLSIQYFNHNFGRYYNLKDKLYFCVLALEMGMIFVYLELISGLRYKVFEGLILLTSAITMVSCFKGPLHEPMSAATYMLIGMSGIAQQLLWGFLILTAVGKKRRNALFILPGYALFMAGVVHDALAISGLFIIDVYLISLSYPILLFNLGILFIKNHIAVQKDIEYLEEMTEKNDLIQAQKKELEKRNYTLENDLRLARVIQQSMIPGDFPDQKIFALYKPMEAIGGDFYDFIRFREESVLGVIICDVSGHGAPAALITAVLKGYIERAGSIRQDPAALLSFLNQSLFNYTGSNFITILYLVYNYQTGLLQYSNAGHPAPILIDGEQIAPLNGTASVPIGVFSNSDLERKNKTYRTNQLHVKTGSRLFLYTDGILEVESMQNPPSMFQECALDNTVKEMRNASPQDFIVGIYQRLVAFRGNDMFDDDICMICIDV